MKIALVHDYIKEYGGAERVLEALHEIWPEEPVFTSVFLPEFLGPHRERFKDWDIRTSFLQYIPFKEKLISPFRLIAPFVFKIFDMSSFDVVIVSGTGAYNPNIIKIPNSRFQIPNKSKIPNTKYIIRNTVHICYCHTPPRYLYGFATAREWKKNLIFRAFGEIANHFLRLVDFRSSQNVDYFIANSKNVANRIKKFYRREAVIIYPPVNIPNFQKTQNTQKVRRSESQIIRVSDSSESLASRSSEFSECSEKEQDYFLAGGRLARPKHIDLIVGACRELKVPLKIFGRGFIDENIKYTNKKSNIEYLGEVSDEEKLELMRNARAYIFAAEDEDFGITPVEAMSVGTPVIAYRSGGVVESVIDGKTGFFFDELTVDSLRKAMKQFSNVTINPNDCIKQAEKFSKERFKKEIKEFVEGKLR